MLAVAETALGGSATRPRRASSSAGADRLCCRTSPVSRPGRGSVNAAFTASIRANRLPQNPGIVKLLGHGRVEPSVNARVTPCHCRAETDMFCSVLTCRQPHIGLGPRRSQADTTPDGLAEVQKMSPPCVVPSLGGDVLLDYPHRYPSRNRSSNSFSASRTSHHRIGYPAI